MKIHVVIGHTGEYSDHEFWFVRAFFDEEKTKRFVVEVTEEANAVQFMFRDGMYRQIEGAINKLDPQMRVSYTGVSYCYESVDLDDPAES